MMDSAFELGPIALMTSLTEHKYAPDGKTKVISNTFKAEKGKVFVVAVLDAVSPSEVTAELVSARLKELAAGEWEKTRHGG